MISFITNKNELFYKRRSNHWYNYKIGEVGPGASTTGTVYGVYDMANINGEIVAGFMADSLGNMEINTKYYDIYSYNDYIGVISSSNSISNLYRYKLGDSIRENFRSFSTNGMWQGGLLEHNTKVGVLLRGGNGNIKNASVYTSSVVETNYEAPFRVSIINK